jgi:large subunit ribosomal protein L21
MFAVFKTGGKQYKVQQGDVLQVEKLGVEKDKKVTFDQVLLIADGKKTLIGTPFVDKAKVFAVVIEEFKDDKVLVFKKKRRKQYKKMHGHRQVLTRIRIEDISIGAAAPAKTKEAEPKAKVEKKPAPKAAKAKAAKPITPKKTEAKKPVKKAAAPQKKTTKPAAEKPKASPKAQKVTKTKEK